MRLYEATLTGESTLSPSERSAIVRAMPECIEHTRLCNLPHPLDEEAGRLTKQMWSIPAKTPEGRRAKFFVLLAYFMPENWSVQDADADCDIEYARKFMIEMVAASPQMNFASNSLKQTGRRCSPPVHAGGFFS